MIFTASGGPGRSAEGETWLTICLGLREISSTNGEDLTNDLQRYARRVLHVLDLHLHIILPRVLPVCLTDEEDGVHLTVPHAGESGAQNLSFFAPRHLWSGLPLYQQVDKREDEN